MVSRQCSIFDRAGGGGLARGDVSDDVPVGLVLSLLGTHVLSVLAGIIVQGIRPRPTEQRPGEIRAESATEAEAETEAEPQAV